MAELTPPLVYTQIMGRSFQDYLNENEMYELNFPEPLETVPNSNQPKISIKNC
jgi:hypothetical protein